jgi:hypothetical protein
MAGWLRGWWPQSSKHDNNLFFFLDIVIAADGLYKRDVFRMWFSFQIAPESRRQAGLHADPVSSSFQVSPIPSPWPPSAASKLIQPL